MTPDEALQKIIEIGDPDQLPPPPYDGTPRYIRMAQIATAALAEQPKCPICSKVGELADRARVVESESYPYPYAIQALLAAIPIAGEHRQQATPVCKHCEDSGWCGVPEERCPYCGGKKQATGAGDQREESK